MFSATAAWTIATLGILLLWDASGLDMMLARAAAPAGAFPLRDDWLVSTVLHKGMRNVAWGFAAWLVVGVWYPTGILRRLTRAARIQWVVSLLASVAAINVLKYSSHTSCPWDLVEFGGLGTYVSHWAWGVADGGPGRCFPAGHASAGFGFLGGFFVMYPISRRLPFACLAAALGAGFVLGVAQQLRGAHFMSHSLWTCWFCWVTGWMVDTVAQWRSPNNKALSVHEVS
ncbi:MAG: phosphatase PAP2 family protein [Ramlibacter sp.]|nr:phosphatase PAP2 family protein [Ramlibacter sp.]